MHLHASACVSQTQTQSISEKLDKSSNGGPCSNSKSPAQLFPLCSLEDAFTENDYCSDYVGPSLIFI